MCIIDASAPILPCTLCVKGSILNHTMCVRVFVWVWMWICLVQTYICRCANMCNCYFCSHFALVSLTWVESTTAMPLTSPAPSLPMAHSPRTRNSSTMQCSRPTEQCSLPLSQVSVQFSGRAGLAYSKTVTLLHFVMLLCLPNSCMFSHCNNFPVYFSIPMLMHM